MSEPVEESEPSPTTRSDPITRETVEAAMPGRPLRIGSIAEATSSDDQLPAVASPEPIDRTDVSPRDVDPAMIEVDSTPETPETADAAMINPMGETREGADVAAPVVASWNQVPMDPNHRGTEGDEAPAEVPIGAEQADGTDLEQADDLDAAAAEPESVGLAGLRLVDEPDAAAASEPELESVDGVGLGLVDELDAAAASEPELESVDGVGLGLAQDLDAAAAEPESVGPADLGLVDEPELGLVDGADSDQADDLDAAAAEPDSVGPADLGLVDEPELGLVDGADSDQADDLDAAATAEPESVGPADLGVADDPEAAAEFEPVDGADLRAVDELESATAPPGPEPEPEIEPEFVETGDADDDPELVEPPEAESEPSEPMVFDVVDIEALIIESPTESGPTERGPTETAEIDLEEEHETELPTMEDLRAMAADLDEVDAILERLDDDSEGLADELNTDDSNRPESDQPATVTAGDR